MNTLKRVRTVTDLTAISRLGAYLALGIFDLSVLLDQDNTVEDFTVRYDAELLSGKNNKFEFGFEYTNSDIDYSFVRDDTLTII